MRNESTSPIREKSPKELSDLLMSHVDSKKTLKQSTKKPEPILSKVDTLEILSPKELK